MTTLSALPFSPVDAGEVRGLMRTIDWSRSVLGEPDTWPQELAFATRLMLDSAFPSFIAWGPQLGFLYNDGYALILGDKHPNAMGGRFEEIWAEIWEDISPIVAKAMNGEASYFEDLPLTVHRAAYPEKAWFTFSYSPIYRTDGSVGGMYCTVAESTEKILSTRRQAFRLELANLLRGLTSPQAIIELSTELLGRELEMDRAWYAEIDDDAHRFFTRNMWTSRTLPRVPVDGHIDDYGVTLADRLRRGTVLTIDEIAADSELSSHAAQYRAMEIDSLLIFPLLKNGKLIATLNLARTTPYVWREHDIALARHVAEFAWSRIERVHAEQALRASEARYRTLIDIVDEGFGIIELVRDENGRVADYRFQHVNPAFEKQSGMSNVVGRTVRELMPTTQMLWIDLMARVSASGIAERLEGKAVSTGKWFSVYATRLHPEDTDRLAILFNDITARKEIEESLRQTAAELEESSRRKTEFLATLAHELRNPLAPMRTSLDIIRVRADDARTVNRVHDIMDRQLTHMVKLIDELLDIARISNDKIQLQKSRATLADLVSHAVETSSPLIGAHGHSLQIQLPSTPVFLDVDPVRIEQALTNLLTNAAKYTPAGGRIEITARQAEEEIFISVSDNGMGIPATSLSEIFDMFAQVGKSIDRSHGGLGIGLAIVRRLIEMHGGSVMAESGGEGLGSTFTIRLPVVSCAETGESGWLSTQADIASPAQTAQAKFRRLLVVDDNEEAGDMLAALLQFDGHHVQVARNGVEALERIAQWQPDAAFVDIGMPGMNGYDVARHLRGSPDTEDIVLIAVTGWGADADKANSRDAGFDFHLTKPVAHGDLSSVLKTLR